MSVVPDSNAPGARSSDQAPGRNKPATVGLVLGIVCMVVNPILLVGVGAIIFSTVGLNRATLMGQFGYAPVGKSAAVWGLVLGLLGIIVSIQFKGSLY